MRVKLECFLIAGLVGIFLLAAIPAVSWSHGDLEIVPASLHAKAGKELKVKVGGLVGTKTATFILTGMPGVKKLGTFPITADDFDQVLKIPEDTQPGAYRLSVEGGGKSAGTVITVE